MKTYLWRLSSATNRRFMELLEAVCEAGEVTPQKSTYFFPKMATGLVVNPLDD